MACNPAIPGGRNSARTICNASATWTPAPSSRYSKPTLLHADLHPGNFILLPGPRVGYTDLGMVGRFNEKMKLSMLYSFQTLVNGDVSGSARHLMAIARPGEGGDPTGFPREVIDLSRRYLLSASDGSLSLAQLILESLHLGGRVRIFLPVGLTLMVKFLVPFKGVGL